MSRHGYFFAVIILGVAACLTLACGSSNSSRQIQGISVSPTSADAQNYPGGQVPFVATGMYSTAPTKVTVQANWGAASEQLVNGVEVLTATTDVSVDSKGVAQCGVSATGIYVIGAWVPAGTQAICNVIGGPFNINTCPAFQGTAQLTCP